LLAAGCEQSFIGAKIESVMRCHPPIAVACALGRGDAFARLQEELGAFNEIGGASQIASEANGGGVLGGDIIDEELPWTEIMN
jgi:hypothetical protein